MISFVLFSAILCGLTQAQHGYTYFPQPQSEYNEYTHILVWKVHKTGSQVYLANQFYTNLNSGYFGIATNPSGRSGEKAIAQFSIWHHQDSSGAVVENAAVSSGAPWCHPFGNEGTGIHCDITINLQLNVNYQFEVRRTATGGGRTVWDCYVWENGQNGKVVGQIILNDVRGTPSDHFEGSGISFMEYFAPTKNFETGAGWTGPFINGVGPNMCNTDCDMGYIDACIPGEQCGYPHIYYNVGGSRKGCGKNIWNQYENKNTTIAIPFKKLPDIANPSLWTKSLYEMWNQTANVNDTVQKMEGKPSFHYSKLEKREQKQ